MHSFTKKQIAERTQLTERQVQFYTEQGVITPGVDRSKGRGRPRRYSEWNLSQFFVIKELVFLGVTVGRVREIIEYMEKEPIRRSYGILKEQRADLSYAISHNDAGGLVCNWVNSWEDQSPDQQAFYKEFRSRSMGLVIRLPKDA